MSQVYQASFFDQTRWLMEVEIAKGLAQEKGVALNLVATTRIDRQQFQSEFGKGYIGSAPFDQLTNLMQLSVTPDALQQALTRRTPRLDAWWDAKLTQLQITGIYREAVCPGQNFLRKTLEQCLGSVPEVSTVLFDYVKNIRTCDIILPVLWKMSSVASLPKEKTQSALINALVDCGYGSISIRPMGKSDFSLQGSRSRSVSWQLEPFRQCDL